MTDASTAHGREPGEQMTPEPLFPSEGEFSTVVPLSEVGAAPFTAGRTPDDGRPAEADWAREERRRTAVARRDARAVEEEETLVPSRKGRRRAAAVGSRLDAGRRPWPVTAAAVLLSVLAGVAAGSYLVWSKRPAAVSSAPPAAVETNARPEAPPAEPSTNTPSPGASEIAAAPVEAAEPVAPEAPARAPEAKAEKAEKSAEPSARAAKGTTTTTPAEPATREAAPTRARTERAASNKTEAAPAPRPARAEAPTRRATTTAAATRPTRPATSARQLPVSAPPPSSKSKTVIQWP
ncbi:MAG TPA: hypothetical protein VF588_21800 [Pyrinomonadaceae bacterium]|jgi:hypothetical protein